MKLNDTDFQHIRDYYLEPKNEWAIKRIQRVLSNLGDIENKFLLDLGCGLGTFSFHTSKLKGKAVGIDKDFSALYRGILAVKKIGFTPRPRLAGNATKLPFRNNVFDIVINADFIEHIHDEDKKIIVAESYRVLKPNGIALIYSPNLERILWELRGEKIKLMLGMRKTPVPSWAEYVDSDHFGMTTPEFVIKILKEAGFKKIKERYYEFHVPLLSKSAAISSILEPVLQKHFSNRFLMVAEK